ncbi:DUF3500 domain-containing protein [Sulfurimonas sp.]|uniref:DUF3500 domain-containing protein n=1 Tax=Sulfurimonas sp. TaxID=2022749 RepID=UPI003D0EFAB5
MSVFYNKLSLTLIAGIFIFSLVGCGNSNDTSSLTDTNSSGSTETNSTDTNSSSSACDGDTDIEVSVCAAETFLATLTDDQEASVVYDWDDATAKTRWINLPVQGHPRSGITFEELSTSSITAALALAKTVLSDAGYEDFAGIRAADDYLNEIGGSGYGSELYSIAIIGTPSVDDDWMLMLGGHHMAYNITFISGTGYPTPHHAGVEPKASFEIESETYSPLADEGDAMVAVFDALSTTQLSDAYLEGETYSDVLVGPEYEVGYADTSRYPTSSRGLSVSELSDAQKEVLIASIEEWVADYSGDIYDPLIADYTSDDALSETYIAWAGSQSAGIDVDTSGTYMRIDGPRVWIEIACQTGVIISSKTHYHAMYRDKEMDYGGSI